MDIFFLSVLSVLLINVVAIEPITTTLLVGGGITTFLAFTGKSIYCQLRECCVADSKRWIDTSVRKSLESRLDAKLYGQHLVRKSVVSLVSQHLIRSPPAALALSFHGWTGTGKNHVAKLIADSIYKKGTQSRFVHIWSGPKNFPRVELTDDYKDQIRDWVTSNITECPYQLFIFDEVDKMADGLLDVLSPFLDFLDPIKGVDYRKSIYIFLSNSGGEELFEDTLAHWKSGKTREQLELKDIENRLKISAYHQKGGLKDSALIEKAVINFVPFLPLEKSHINKCIADELIAREYSPTAEYKDTVLQQLQFIPDDVGVFSATGCKRVSTKVSYVLGHL